MSSRIKALQNEVSVRSGFLASGYTARATESGGLRCLCICPHNDIIDNAHKVQAALRENGDTRCSESRQWNISWSSKELKPPHRPQCA